MQKQLFAGLINISNRQKIILGGLLSIAGGYLMPGIKEAVVFHALFEIDLQAKVPLSSFGLDASLIGATAVLADHILSKPVNLKGGDCISR